MTKTTRYDRRATHTTPEPATVRWDREEAERWARKLSSPGVTGACTVAAATDAPVRARFFPAGREAEYFAALDTWSASSRRPAPYRAFPEETT